MRSLSPEVLVAQRPPHADSAVVLSGSGVCLWPETMSPVNWSVILSPYEGDDHVEPQGADPGQSPSVARRKEVHIDTGSRATRDVKTSPVSAPGSIPGGGPGGSDPRQPREEAGARHMAGCQRPGGGAGGLPLPGLQPHPPA